MKRPTIANISIYKWRYALTYTAVAVSFVGILLLVSLVIPGGISGREMSSIATSSALSWQNFSAEMVINLPYYALQRAIIELFGVSVLTIKLATIIIAAFSGLGLVLLLKTWFRSNVALLTALMAFTIGPFLLSAQSGNPGILYIFWPVWILYTATMVSRRARFRLIWKISLLVLVAGSLYTPLSLYVLIALISAAVLHPHLRHIVRQLNKIWLAGAACFGLIAATPLIFAVVLQPALLLRLLGVQGAIDIGASFSQLLSQYFNFFQPSAGIIMTPVYSLPIVLIALLGLYRMFVVRHTARSYILFAWILLLIPALYINPQLISVTFVPAVLLTGYGIDFIIRSWYGLFPKNPYARVVGLIPITILIVSLAVSGIDRFMYGYLYSATPPHIFSRDVTLLASELKSNSTQGVTLAVTSSEYAFYEAFKTYNSELGISTIIRVSQETKATLDYQNMIVTNAAQTTAANYPTPFMILTDGANQDADRFYLYKTNS